MTDDTAFTNGRAARHSAPPAGRPSLVIGSDAPPTLDIGTRQLLHDLATLVDRGLEHAEAVLHERRQRDEADGFHDERTYQALEALAHVRRITSSRA